MIDARYNRDVAFASFPHQVFESFGARLQGSPKLTRFTRICTPQRSPRFVPLQLCKKKGGLSTTFFPPPSPDLPKGVFQDLP